LRLMSITADFRAEFATSTHQIPGCNVPAGASIVAPQYPEAAHVRRLPRWAALLGHGEAWPINRHVAALECIATGRMSLSNAQKISRTNAIAAICPSWPNTRYVQPIKWRRRRRRLAKRNQFSDRLTFAKRCHSMPPPSGFQLGNRQHRHMRHHARLATCRHSQHCGNPATVVGGTASNCSQAADHGDNSVRCPLYPQADMRQCKTNVRYGAISGHCKRTGVRRWVRAV
jgi:hypothetical protein